MNLKFEPKLMKDRALAIDFLEAFRRNLAEVIYDSENVLLVRLDDSSVFFHMGGGEEGVNSLESALNCHDDFSLIVAHDEEIKDYLVNEHGYDFYKGCIQVLYEKEEKLPMKGSLIIHNPSPKEFEKFRSTYGIGDDEMKREEFMNPEFFGGYLVNEYGEEKMIGYVGEHSEGAIGLLYVFPEHRGKGFAYELQSFMINRQLDKGAFPYGQIYEENEASMALSRKMGLTFSDGMVYWLWKDLRKNN